MNRLALPARVIVGVASCSTVASGLMGAAPAAAHFNATAHVARPGPTAATNSTATNQSGNWSGYNIGADYPGIPTGTTFTSVSGTWVVPTATQHTKGEAEDSASWVGIGGGCVDDSCTVTDNTLIQAGTEQHVSKSGKAKYVAWWEIIPEPETPITLGVAPGNTVRVTLNQTAPGTWSILIDNLSTGKSFSTTTAYSSSMDTAEWIEETPLEIGTGGSEFAAMPNLGVVHFKGGKLNGANPGYQTVDEMQLSSNGTILATPSAPNSKGTAFNDCTYAATCAAP
jgi:hypothetical protein